MAKRAPKEGYQPNGRATKPEHPKTDRILAEGETQNVQAQNNMQKDPIKGAIGNGATIQIEGATDLGNPKGTDPLTEAGPIGDPKISTPRKQSSILEGSRCFV